jgi:signal transduction histidine kinase
VSVFWLVAARTGFRQPAVLLAGAAVTVSAIGDSYWALSADADGALPFPSPADIGYLLFYPLMVAALLVLARRRLAGVGALVLLETAVATVGASAVLAVVLDPAIATAASESTFGGVVASAYPLFDLLLLAVVAGIASARAVPFERHGWALVAGLAIFAVADVAYALLENDGAYVAGTPLDATWAIGLGLITWWVAGVPDAVTDQVVPPRRNAVGPLPAVAVLTAVVLLVIGTQVRLSTLAVALAAITVALGAAPFVFRQAMLGRMLAAQEAAVTRLTELDRAKSDLLATVNHEFRTPLTSINGHVELLLDGGAGDLPPAATGMLETVERNGRRLQELMDLTFASSRFEEHPQLKVDVPVDVTALVERAVARVAPFASLRGGEVVAAAGDSPGYAHGDPEQLEQAVVNVLDNAVKFGGEAPRVAVTTGVAGEAVLIRVYDQGIGIPDEEQRDIFSRFFRASNARRAAIPGVGLGLSIARQIVAAHDGAIGVESATGAGTTVTIRLPAAQPAA